MPTDKTLVIETITVNDITTHVRILDYINGKFFNLESKSACKKSIERGFVLLNGKRATLSNFVTNNDKIDLTSTIDKKGIELKLEILFEDDYLAAVNKPSGIIVSGNKRYTLENALQNNINRSKLIDALERAEPVHRLDFQTSGILLVGKTKQSVIRLNKMFESRDIKKRYIAITIGKMNDSGLIDEKLDGKPSITRYTVLKSKQSKKYDFLNIVEIAPETGRMHQIRRHLSAIGNPIFGDQQYGIEGLMPKGRGLLLHAWKIEFIHPFTEKPILIESAMPHKFEREFERCP